MAACGFCCLEMDGLIERPPAICAFCGIAPDGRVPISSAWWRSGDCLEARKTRCGNMEPWVMGSAFPR